jgi:hypothetical protein
MPHPAPFLAQVSERPFECLPLPTLFVGIDGMLHRDGALKPIVEELLETNTLTPELNSTITIVTDTKPDQPDPDVIRRHPQSISEFDSRWMITIVTKGGDDAPDPDGLRAALSGALFTTFTNGQVDRPDPDGFRRLLIGNDT